MFDIDKMYVMMPYYEVETPKAATLGVVRQMIGDSKNKSARQFRVELEEKFSELIKKGFAFDFQNYTETVAQLKRARREEANEESERSITERKEDVTKAVKEVNKLTEQLISDLMSSEFLGLNSQSELAKYYKLKGNRLKYSSTKGTTANEANKLIQLYKGILTNPKTLNAVYRPIDYEFLKTITQKIVASKSKNQEESLYHMDPYVDVDLLYDFRNGKAGVGQEANSMVELGRVGNLYLDNMTNFKHLHFKDGYVKLDEEKSQDLSPEEMDMFMKFLNLSPEQEQRIREELTNVDIMASMVSILNGFVDIAKDPFITQGGWLTSTTNLGNALLRMGMHPVRVIMFMAQPAVAAAATLHTRPSYKVKKDTFINLKIIEDYYNLNSHEDQANIKEVLTKLINGEVIPTSSNDGSKLSKRAIETFNNENDIEITEKDFLELTQPMYEEFDSFSTSEKTIYSVLKDLGVNKGYVVKSILNSLSIPIEVDKDGTPISTVVDNVFKQLIEDSNNPETGISEEDVQEVRNIFKKRNKDTAINNLNYKESFMVYIKLNNTNKAITPLIDYLLQNPNEYSFERGALEVKNNKNEKLNNAYALVLGHLNEMSDKDTKNMYHAIEAPLSSWINNTIPSKIDFKFQASVSSMITRLREVSSEIKANTTLSRMDTDGTGKSISNMVPYENAKEQLLNKGVQKNEFLIGFENKFINTPLGVFYDNFMKFFRQAIQNTDLFFDLKPSHIEVANKISLILKNQKIVNNELFENVRNNIYSAMMTQFFNISEAKTNYLLKDFPAVFDAFKEAYRGEFRILEDLNNRLLDTPGIVSNLIYKGNKEKSNLQEEAIVQSWDRMLKHPNSEVRQFANDLVEYSFITSGFKYNSKQFYSLIPSSYFIANDINTYVKNFDINSTEKFKGKPLGMPDFIHRYLRLNVVGDKKAINGIKKVPGGKPVFIESEKLFKSPKKITTPITQDYYEFDGAIYKLAQIVGDVKEGGSDVYWTKLPKLGYNIDNSVIPFYGDVNSREALYAKDYLDEEIERMRSGAYQVLTEDSLNLYQNNLNYRALPTAYYSQNIRDFNGDPIVSKMPNATKISHNSIGRTITIDNNQRLVVSMDFGNQGYFDYTYLDKEGNLKTEHDVNVEDFQQSVTDLSEPVDIYVDKDFGRIFAFNDAVYNSYGVKIESLKRLPLGVKKLDLTQELDNSNSLPELYREGGLSTASNDVKSILSELKESLFEKGMTQEEFNSLMWNKELNGLSAEEIKNYIENC